MLDLHCLLSIKLRSSKLLLASCNKSCNAKRKKHAIREGKRENVEKEQSKKIKFSNKRQRWGGCLAVSMVFLRKYGKMLSNCGHLNKILPRIVLQYLFEGCDALDPVLHVSELYMRLDPTVGTGSAIKLVRKLQRDLEYESFHQTGDSGKVDYDLIEKEIRRLVSRAQASLQAATTSGSSKGGCCLLKDCSSRTHAADLSLGEISEQRRKICKSKMLRAQKEARDLSEGLYVPTFC